MTKPILGQLETDSESAVQRNKDRDSLLLKASIRLAAHDFEGKVRIRNLSAGGLMAEAPIAVQRGETVDLELRNVGWISGKVAWTAEGRFGVAFDHPIDPKIVRQPVSKGKDDLPLHLKKLDRLPPKRNLTRL